MSSSFIKNVTKDLNVLLYSYLVELVCIASMGGSPGELSEELVTQEKR